MTSVHFRLFGSHPDTESRPIQPEMKEFLAYQHGELSISSYQPASGSISGVTRVGVSIPTSSCVNLIPINFEVSPKR